MPPLTPAEKMRRYREKLMLDKEKLDSVKKRDRERKAVKKALRTAKEKKVENMKNKIRVQKFRLKNQQTVRVANAIDKDIRNATPRKVFNSAQALGKARSRVKRQLPNFCRINHRLINNFRTTNLLLNESIHCLFRL